MSGSFSGFTEDYILKMSNKNANTPPGVTIHLSSNSPLKTPMPPATHESDPIKRNSNLSQDEILTQNLQTTCINESLLEKAVLTSPNDTYTSLTDTTPMQLNRIDTSEFKMKKDLGELQTRQKLIEEQNRKRKELLAKALDDRTKRTLEETRKLNDIKEELKKLDAVLSSDVNILRHQIEIASVDYMEAQKRYYKIEQDFLNAKLNLHQKLDKKETLTEHLYTIIEKNEERKAEKLKELLCKLNLDKDLVKETTEVVESTTIS